MFTGIIEEVGEISRINPEGGNMHFSIKAAMTPELKIDQSVAHNGVCLTVVSINDNEYTVTAVAETLEKTNLKNLAEGSPVNLERGMKLGDRLDGHIVQGHVDQTAVCKKVQEKNGSWEFTFEYDTTLQNITIEKGSITVNGVSLTVVNSKKNEFSVAIIPYTYEHTTFKYFKEGDVINLEFDVIGKYVKRIQELK
ncbi:riboflavin synthase [Salegentibacter salarius]|uniref:Riboflavin synthase n=1 Tax=Salegentibacter salarius TaxID=435906 RepID=A0A2N0U534_9FLAO|nr:riboflavin synthase [Salegentibacter salarius]OEY71334.1 riboflavin synthase subunit alpha [Salegentibacter salarius]PKD22016.1 riboflavin synthase subunit alpha [Salegentibacter salarius]SLJ92588.1 riboflavin synthase alpha chain [Salegentibacter salarius]